MALVDSVDFTDVAAQPVGLDFMASSPGRPPTEMLSTANVANVMSWQSTQAKTTARRKIWPTLSSVWLPSVNLTIKYTAEKANYHLEEHGEHGSGSTVFVSVLEEVGAMGKHQQGHRQCPTFDEWEQVGRGRVDAAADRKEDDDHDNAGGSY
ncbi:unnamed protein product [Prorocentrum cordatum]|uniref:Uncharacterized protein n=1 Tax=Prorocentrum cordatum TaxID=2364126 RepID=A0ABN9Y481_9DINO|nr:unnamed protein product [Polarella glacialis]